MNRDQLYKSLDRTDYLRVTDLPETFQVEFVEFDIEYNINKYGTLRNGTVSAGAFCYIFSGIKVYIFTQPKFSRTSNYIRSFSFA